ncbi:hypothetical protein [Flavobacterium sp.]|uniref:hypothetical protein n=1 Tax=Flavobacterium sp. TaxID=239 RepID=UPI0038FD0A48
MKKILFISVLFTSFLFSSCGDDLEELLDVKFNTTITEEIPVTVIAGTNSLIESTEFSLIENTETSKYLDKLKTIEIKKMTYKIIEFTGDSTGKITAVLEADGETLHSISDKTVNTEFVNATVFEVTNKAALLNAATSLLKNKKISLKTNGQTVSTSPMSFKIKLTLDLDVVANPL